MINFISQFICHFHGYKLTMACPPIGLSSLLDRTLWPGFNSCSSLNFFLFLFFFFFIFNHLGFLFNCEDHVHFHNMTFNFSIDLTFDQFQLIPSSPQLSVAILSCSKFNIAWVRGGDNLSYYYLLESQDF